MIENILFELTLTGLAIKKGNKYLASVHHRIEGDLTSLKALKILYFENLLRLKVSAEKNFEAKDKLFFQSCFTIKQDKRVALKKQLIDLLIDFVDLAEDPDGDSVADLILGFH